MGDITALRRCTAILMENACRYTESGTVEIGLEAEQGFVTLLVKDTGIGIAPQHMPHLFERFYRGNGVRRANGFEGEPHRAKNGSGLGLSLAKWIVDQHHAELLVESRFLVPYTPTSMRYNGERRSNQRNANASSPRISLLLSRRHHG
jgi:two-component system sensor histidine kinase CiaH